jgi:hypothetical protein
MTIIDVNGLGFNANEVAQIARSFASIFNGNTESNPCNYAGREVIPRFLSFILGRSCKMVLQK